MGDDRLSDVERRLHDIDEALAALCQRIVALEHVEPHTASPPPAPAAPVVTGVVTPVVDAPRERPGAWIEPTSVLSLAGRTLVILGGAYLLRALTDSGQVPLAGGIALGLAYASIWIGAADRTAASHPASGLFFGLTGLVLGAALIWEASTRFALLAPRGSAAVLGVLALAGLAVAWHRRLESLGVVVTVTSGLTALALAVATDRMVPYAFSAIAITAVAAGFGTRGWRWPRWPAAASAGLLVVATVSRSLLQTSPVEPAAAALASSATLFLLWVVLVVLAAAAGRAPQPFDLFFALTALLCGVGGSLAVAAIIDPTLRALTASAVLMVGALGYLAILVRGEIDSARSLAYFTTMAMVLLLWGEMALLGDGAARWLAATAVALFITGRKLERPIVTAHGAVFTCAAAFASAILPVSARIWVGAPPFPSPGAVGFLVLAVAAFGLFVGSSSPRSFARTRSVSRAALAIVFVAGAGALVVAALVRVAGGESSPGIVASVKTIALATMALALAAVGRAHVWRELGWLAAPLLAIAGLKLVVEDLRVSPAALLFVVLGVYGVSLILTSRLAARRRSSPRGSL